jgi:glycerol-3-phosphate acyltransferase PlsX
MIAAEKQIGIAIDAMGGDHAPFSIVAGTVMGYRVLQPNVKLVLVGNADSIYHELHSLRAENLPIEVVDAPETFDMNENPIEAVRQKKKASINVGLALQKQGRVDAFISAGNTGAVMTASLLTLRRCFRPRKAFHWCWTSAPTPIVKPLTSTSSVSWATCTRNLY